MTAVAGSPLIVLDPVSGCTAPLVEAAGGQVYSLESVRCAGELDPLQFATAPTPEATERP